MNLAAGGALPRRPETGVWFRAIQPQFWTTSLATAQTAGIPSRFNAGATTTPRSPASSGGSLAATPHQPPH